MYHSPHFNLNTRGWKYKYLSLYLSKLIKINHVGGVRSEKTSSCILSNIRWYICTSYKTSYKHTRPKNQFNYALRTQLSEHFSSWSCLRYHKTNSRVNLFWIIFSHHIQLIYTNTFQKYTDNNLFCLSQIQLISYYILLLKYIIYTFFSS